MAKLAPIAPAEVADVLERARKRMNSGGKHWIKGSYKKKVDGEVCYCSLGAIFAETKRGRVRDAAIRVLGGCLPHHYSRWPISKVWRWNDNPKRKWADVDKKFREAVKAAKKGEF